MTEKHIIVHDGAVHRALAHQTKVNRRFAVLVLATVVYIFQNERRMKDLEQKLKELTTSEGE